MFSRVAEWLFKVYRLFISPALHLFSGPTMGCRFEPTCSEYCRESFHLHGPFRGGWLAMKRLARCQPFSVSGYDPVPRAIAKSQPSST